MDGAVTGNTESFVYVIGARSPDGVKTYVGWTLDPERRLAQHNSGAGAKSTRGRQWHLLYVEKFDSRVEAMSREWHLKRDRPFRRQLAAAYPQMEPSRPPHDAGREYA